MEKKCRKAKWLSGEVLQIAVKRKEAKSKGEKEKYKHLNAEVLITVIYLGLFRQSFCFFAFLFHGDGLDPYLLYSVTNLRP